MTDDLDMDALTDEEPKRELSPMRIAIAILILVGLLGASAFAINRSRDDATAPGGPGATWFAPYVDTTLTPAAQFQDPSTNPARQSVLGFVVADKKNPCAPSWGAAYTLDQAASSLALDRRIAQYRAQGGDPLVSFGGAANTELASSCEDPEKLAAAYSDVVTRYAQTTVDFDIEGAALADTAATQRRATAIATAQKAAKEAGKPFDVWLTLPVATSGLESDALAVVTTTLAAGVDVAGVNIMAMNYGTPQKDMGDAVHSSVTATHNQLRRVYSKYGVADNAVKTWQKMGVTVMIGQNDSDGEIFTTDDAQQLTDEVNGWGLAHVSMWSLNRDSQCGGSYAVVGVHSNTCSGTEQTALAFSHIFTGAFTGTVPSVSDGPTATPGASVVPDNPETSPYPLWQASRPYETGYKVVRNGNVYQAKWFSQGQDPAAATTDPSQSPWQLIGPVLPGESPAPLPTVAPGTYPNWSASKVYEAGDRVLYNLLPYEAKWYNTATSPGAQDADPSASPWKPLFTVPGEPTADGS